MEATTIVGIDVGTTKICTLVAEVNSINEIRILGAGVVPSQGIRRGIIVNVAEATAAIKASLRQAEKSSGYEIVSAYVGLAGAHIDSINNRGSVTLSNGHHGIQTEQINRALEAARSISLPEDRQILHVIPRNFTVDDEDGIKDPVGMYGHRLGVEAHIVTGATASINNLVRCAQDANIEVDALVLEPIASGEAVLTSMERDMGVVLADIGGGTTDIAVFIEGSIWHSTVLPVGGLQLTNDIAVGLQMPFNAAEEIKLQAGHADPSKVFEHEMVEMPAFGSEERQRVSRRFLAQIIRARTEEIIELIQKEIKRTGYDGLLPAGIVLCGGTANLPGIKDVADAVLGLPVRVGAPQNLRGFIDDLNGPAYATSVGLLEWGKHHQPETYLSREPIAQYKLPTWLKVFLPG